MALGILTKEHLGCTMLDQALDPDGPVGWKTSFLQEFGTGLVAHTAEFLAYRFLADIARERYIIAMEQRKMRFRKV